jgi:hypothetical protein
MLLFIQNLHSQKNNYKMKKVTNAVALAATLIFATLPFLGNTQSLNISVTYPGTAQVFHSGETIKIYWTTVGFNPNDSVNIDLAIKDSTGNITNANLLHYGPIMNTGWDIVQIPYNVPPDSNYVIHIDIVGDSGKFTSNISTPFTIKKGPTITIASPNGGEIYHVGDTILVTWSTTGIDSTDEVRIFLGGSTCLWYIDTVQNTGSASIVLPDPSTAPFGCGGYGKKFFIEVLHFYGPGSPDARDYSDSTFSILDTAAVSTVPSLTITSPNGGEVYSSGDQVLFTWDSQNIPPSAMMGISISSDSSTQLISNCALMIGLFPNTGSVLWTIPDPPTFGNPCVSNFYGQHYKVKIFLFGSIVAVEDSSNAKFSIVPAPPAPVITITSPNGGEVYYPEDTVTVTWDTQNIPIGDSLIFYVDTDTLSLGTGCIVDGIKVPNTGSYLCTIPDPATYAQPCYNLFYGKHYAMSMYHISLTGAMDASDNSDSNFSIIQTPPLLKITLTSPNGGETFTAGQQMIVTWNTVGYSDSALVRINLMVKDSITNSYSNTFIVPLIPRINDGIDTILIPANTPAGYLYSIRIDIKEPLGTYSGGDISDSTFSILPAILAMHDLHFTASLQKDIVKLVWNSSTGETYEIQKSIDAQHWENISQTSSSSFDDTHPLSGVSYYRLKVSEKDGTFSYSNIEKISYRSNTIRVFPTLVQSACTISGIKTGEKVQVYSSDGVLLFSKVSSRNSMDIDLSNFPKGIYVIVSGEYSTKVIKQ